MRGNDSLGITLVGDRIATGEGRKTLIGKWSISCGSAVFGDGGEGFGYGGGKSLRIKSPNGAGVQLVQLLQLCFFLFGDSVLFDDEQSITISDSSLDGSIE